MGAAFDGENGGEKWKDERFLFEKLKQEQAFRRWKKRQFDCQRGRCALCGKPMQYRYTETDHILPLYCGGNSDPKNMVLCHHKCNKEKSTSTNYSRPEWIVENPYDYAVLNKYNQLKSILSTSDNEVDSSATRLITRFGPISDVTGEPVTATGTAQPDTQEQNASSNTGKIVLAVALTMLALLLVLPLLINGNRNNSAAPHSASGSSSSSSYSNKDAVTNDDVRKKLADTIAKGYTTFYNYWVMKKGYELPDDRTNCTTWNGCSLSFPLGSVQTEEGYTYSINSLGSGVMLSQNGELPNATQNNAALYKRAQCASDGEVIGGDMDQNAATVIRLADGTYYCVSSK